MAAEKCLECKYYEEGKYRIGRCILHGSYKCPDDTCEDFTCKNSNPIGGGDPIKIIELEQRVATLERLMMRYM